MTQEEALQAKRVAENHFNFADTEASIVAAIYEMCAAEKMLSATLIRSKGEKKQ